jgi:hypothetical protein
MGDKVVPKSVPTACYRSETLTPRVDLAATSLEALQSVKLEDLKRFEAVQRDRTEL